VKGDWNSRGFATRAIHAGQHPDPATGSVSVPIYATSTYVQDELGRHKGFEYARVQNPTRAALEANVASLEGGVSGHAFASGMSAIATLMTLVRSGEHVVCSRNVYGGTYRSRRAGSTRPISATCARRCGPRRRWSTSRPRPTR